MGVRLSPPAPQRPSQEAASACASGGIGIRTGLKPRRASAYAGSTPAARTTRVWRNWYTHQIQDLASRKVHGSSTLPARTHLGPVAQLGERPSEKREVNGSTPFRATQVKRAWRNWHTRLVEGQVIARSWGFESPRSHRGENQSSRQAGRLSLVCSEAGEHPRPTFSTTYALVVQLEERSASNRQVAGSSPARGARKHDIWASNSIGRVPDF